MGIAVPVLAHAGTGVRPSAVTHRAAPQRPDLRFAPWEERRYRMRQEAVDGVLRGKIEPVRRGGGLVARMGRGGRADQYVELAREKTDKVFVILAEFGDERHPDYPDVDTEPDVPGPTVFDGPRHNRITKPDPAVDNSSVWQADYDRRHYDDLLFGSGENTMKSYFQKQSAGRYSIEGEVTDWVKVRYNEARYGRLCTADGACDGDHIGELIEDAVTAWIAREKAAGRTDAELTAKLATYDAQDPDDFDGDGDFAEPDGYLDRFQIVHAGDDRATGVLEQGEDAIWAHRAWAFAQLEGEAGPADNKRGGVRIGGTDLWVGGYTIMPENGGLTVFAHEYTHDLGLRDDYDPLDRSVDNAEAWNLLGSTGGHLSAAGGPLGVRAADIGAWGKLQLGWLDHRSVRAGEKHTVDLGPSEYRTTRPQALVVTLPDLETPTDLGAPAAGERQYFSGAGSAADTTMTRELDLTGAATARLTMKARYSLDTDLDFVSVEASTDGGGTWTALDGTVRGAAFGRDADGRPALTGTTADKENGDEWADLSVALDAQAGRRIQLRLRYRSLAGSSSSGFFGDEITVTKDGTTVLSDGAEQPSTWTLDGFVVEDSTGVEKTPQSYVAAYRAPVSYDRNLKNGAFNYGWSSTRPKWIENFSYQNGLLVTYDNTAEFCNCISARPGQGRNLNIDAHPRPLTNPAGALWDSGVQMYDATFSKFPAESLTLHLDGKAQRIAGGRAQPVFDDTEQYFYEGAPWGVKLPAVGVRIEIVRQEASTMTVRVS
nr:immune inhibitor A domain-containing protein [Actinoplanes ferrugineus]